MSKYPPAVETYWLGSLGYRPAWALQRALVAEILAGLRGSTLLLLEHPHVYTMGRRGSEDHVLWNEVERARRSVELVWCDRGGDATYHGPGQLVGYPLLDLAALGSDILVHLRQMEQSLIAYLASLGIHSEPGGKGLTGVWSEGAKVAAIGVRLHERRVTSHGFALNLQPDLNYFQGIVPCGLSDREATSVERLSGLRIESAAAARGYAAHFESAYGATVRWCDERDLAALAANAPPEPANPRELWVSPAG